MVPPVLGYLVLGDTPDDAARWLAMARRVETSTNLVAASEHEAREIISTCNTLIVVRADDNGNYDDVGYMAYRLLPSGEEPAETVYLAEFAVAPEFRGRGFGTQALQALIDTLHRQGIPRCTLMTHPENTGALGLYHKLGFAETGRRDDNYENSGTPRIELLKLIAGT
ncbi:MAG TPA: N-acetyltransferase [Candidatus Paceibacterota bacterium]